MSAALIMRICWLIGLGPVIVLDVENTQNDRSRKDDSYDSKTEQKNVNWIRLTPALLRRARLAVG